MRESLIDDRTIAVLARSLEIGNDENRYSLFPSELILRERESEECATLLPLIHGLLFSQNSNYLSTPFQNLLARR